MRIVDKQTGKTLGKVTTNHSLSLEEACELAGIECDPDTMAMDWESDDSEDSKR